jgi:hypothetical protein
MYSAKGRVRETVCTPQREGFGKPYVLRKGKGSGNRRFPD